jgi:(p)ppGpp synthase/HD superfamily hydrolase
VIWLGEGDSEPYAVKLSVLTEDRQGQLAALTNAIANIKTNIRHVRTDDNNHSDGIRRIDLTVDISDVKHLERVSNALKGVEGVIEVERLAEFPQNN